MQIRKALSPEKIKTPTVVESESKEGEDEGEDEDERVLNEIEEKTNILEKKQKKEKKLQAKRRAKVYAYAPPSLFQFLFWFAAVVYIIVKTVPYNIIWGVLFLLSSEELMDKQVSQIVNILCFSLMKTSVL